MTGPTTLALTAVLSVVASISARAEIPEFAVARIGGVLAPDDVSFAHAVSEDGDAVGEIWFNGYRQAFVYTYEHGPMLLPFVNDHPNARAFDISDRDANGEVIIAGVGADSFYDEIGNAVFWRYSTVTGTVLEVVEIDPLPGYQQAVAVAVNNEAKIVGYSRTPGIQPMVYDVPSGVLSSLDFPATPSDINNAGQVVGGTYLGDLAGNVVDLGVPPDTVGVTLTSISDDGWIAGTALMPYTDGAGRRVRGVVRYGGSWELLYANSAFDTANDINDPGDVVGAMGVGGAIRPVVYLDAMAQTYLVNDLISPEHPFSLGLATAINGAGQIAGGYQAVVLTPLGRMIIPGDVNGDATVDLDDHCAWRADPVDLDGDGDADADDEQWLIDRLERLGFAVVDCNANGVPDRCDITGGASADCDENDIPDECEADCDDDGVPDTCEADCNDNGFPDDCDLLNQTSQDCNGNGVPDECDGSDTMSYANPFDPPLLLLAESTYTDELLVTGSGDVADVDFTFDIDYRIGDLTVRLSHDDVTITLIDRPGHPDVFQGNGQLGYRITLDDEGTGGPIENEGNFGSPFEPIESPPSFVPDDALAAFDGMPVGGVWTVEVTTSPGYSPVSAFISWGVVITDEDVSAECGPGDVNADGVVDFQDLRIVLGSWGPCGDPCPADADGDGTVGFGDILVILANWS